MPIMHFQTEKKIKCHSWTLNGMGIIRIQKLVRNNINTSNYLDIHDIAYYTTYLF